MISEGAYGWVLTPYGLPGLYDDDDGGRAVVQDFGGLVCPLHPLGQWTLSRKTLLAWPGAGRLQPYLLPNCDDGALVTYLVASEAGLKIGKSTELPKRLNAIRTAVGLAIHVIGWRQGDHERELHERFSPLRLTGEWFEPHDDIVDAFVADVAPWANGTGDIEVDRLLRQLGYMAPC